MKSFSLLLGARNTRGKGRAFSPRDDRLIREVTARHFPQGFTILKSSGGWFDPDKRKFVEEASRQILVCATTRRPLRPWATELAQTLRQRELLVVEFGAAITFRFAW